MAPCAVAASLISCALRCASSTVRLRRTVGDRFSDKCLHRYSLHRCHRQHTRSCAEALRSVQRLMPCARGMGRGACWASSATSRNALQATSLVSWAPPQLARASWQVIWLFQRLARPQRRGSLIMGVELFYGGRASSRRRTRARTPLVVACSTASVHLPRLLRMARRSRNADTKPHRW